MPYNDDSEPESDEEDFDLSGMDPEDMDGISDDAQYVHKFDIFFWPKQASCFVSQILSRFEEINEEPASSAPVASKKRARESDDAHAETAEKLTKAQKKKLKAESGAAVPSASDAKVDAAKTNGDAVKEKKDKKETAKKAGD